MRCRKGCPFRFVDEDAGPICGHCDDQISRLLHCPRGIVKTLEQYGVFKRTRRKRRT
jgi:hypothetical protein